MDAPLLLAHAGVALMRVLPVGSRAALVEVADTETALAVATAARRHGIRADDIVPAARTVLFDGVDVASLQAELSLLDLRSTVERRSLVEIVAHYDGPDLAFVADRWGCSTTEVVQRHTSLTFTAAFCGFAPGFAYLSGLPSEWALPRLDTPRTRVRAGSIALADTWCAVYPHASPGGWRVIGTTEHRLWDPASREPATLAPGVQVRFVAS